MAVAEGARVFVTALQAEECEALAREIHCAWHACDLREEASARQTIAQCVERYGGIDGLFNVAGISGRRYGDGPLHECSLEGWETTMSANVRTTFLMSREVVRWMMAHPPAPGEQRGSVLNMASVLAFAPEPNYFASHAYAASKGAILSLTRAMAAYYAPHKIRVNAVAPGLVETPMSVRAQSNAEIRAFLRGKQPLPEAMLTPEEIAYAAVYLLSDEARSVTGEVLTVDGGWSVSS